MSLVDSTAEKAFIALQYILPKKTITKIAGCLASCKSVYVKNALILLFIKYYDVNMTEAKYPEIYSYNSFNEFFARDLRDDARQLTALEHELASPADGIISQLGDIKDGRIFQAKGFDYSLEELLGNDAEQASKFQNHSFATIYLSPKDYHQVHMPYAGTLEKMTYIPGDLFSVNTATTTNLRNLFTRNERVVNIFHNEKNGDLAVVMVGAMIVGSINTVWHNRVYSADKQDIFSIEYDKADHEQNIFIPQGEKMGFFELGSTVIILFDKKNTRWKENITVGSKVQVGQPLTTTVD